MHRLFFWILPCLFLGLYAGAQTNPELVQDDSGRYMLSHVATAAGASKEALYERLKIFVVDDLNASDTYVSWDEASHDSIVTVAYLELPNSPEMKNQVVSCKAKLTFSEGTATLQLSGFNYDGLAIYGGMQYSKPLHRMNPIPDATQSWIRIMLGDVLHNLTAKMDALANGQKVRQAKRSQQR